MKKNLKQLLTLLLTLALCLCSVQLPTAALETEAADLTPYASSNTGSQNYTYYHATPLYSYLVECDNSYGTYMRVEYTGSSVLVEYYDSAFVLTAQQYIDCELPLFGGFYEGDDAYYIVYGQENSAEDDSVEVIRVVKYSKSWERLGAAGLYGANTTIPFDAGSLRMTECNGYLYIRTCHEMYAIDGVNHQANLTMEVQESDMTVTDYYYGIMNVRMGYVSHSFNQFIIVDDDNNLIALDHGDASPRTAVLFKYNTKAGNSTYGGQTYGNSSNVNVFTFESNTGYHYNYTFASLGGLEYSSSSYLVAGSSVVQDENAGSYTGSNVFVTVTSRSNFSSDGTQTKWITDYASDGTVSASTPQLVKLGDDSFLLLWTTTEYPDPDITFICDVKLHYVYLDGEGNIVGEIQTVDGQLSDCQPIVTEDGSVVWYVTGDASSNDPGEETTPLFYSISSDGTFQMTEDIETPVITGIEILANGMTVSWDAVAGAEKYVISFVTESRVYMREVTDGTTYTLNTSTSGVYAIFVEAYAGDSKSSAGNKQVIYYLSAPSAWLENTEEGILVSWYANSAAESYEIYRQAADGSYTFVAETTDTSWTDTEVQQGENCAYQVYAVHTRGRSAAAEVSLVAQETPVLTEVVNSTGGIKVTWTTVPDAEVYYVSCVSHASGVTSTFTIVVSAKSTDEQTETITDYLTSGTEYTIYVTAYTSDSSASSGTVTIMYLEAPTVVYTETEDGALLEWNAVDGAQGYQIYRKAAGEEYTLVADTQTTSWTDTLGQDDEDNQTEDNQTADGQQTADSQRTGYTYRVYAYYDTTLGAASNEVGADAFIYGDVDEDGSVDVTDALIILQSYVGLKELTGTQLQAADVDGSGSVDVTDALMVLQKYVGLLQVFPVEE